MRMTRDIERARGGGRGEREKGEGDNFVISDCGDVTQFPTHDLSLDGSWVPCACLETNRDLNFTMKKIIKKKRIVYVSWWWFEWRERLTDRLYYGDTLMHARRLRSLVHGWEAGGRGGGGGGRFIQC